MHPTLRSHRWHPFVVARDRGTTRDRYGESAEKTERRRKSEKEERKKREDTICTVYAGYEESSLAMRA